MSVTAKTLIESKFASNSSVTEYTAPASTRTIVDKFTATNTDSGAVTITIYLVPSGDSFEDSNMVVKTKSVAAAATADVTELKNHVLNTGDLIVVVASVNNKMVIRASGREVVTLV
jgi:hypothetical protein